jgi:hypothetical protein
LNSYNNGHLEEEKFPIQKGRKVTHELDYMLPSVPIMAAPTLHGLFVSQN